MEAKKTRAGASRWLGEFARLAPYVARHRGLLLVGSALLLLTNVFALTIPWLFKLAIDSIRAGTDSARLALLAASIVGAAVLGAAVRVLSRLAIFGAGRHIEFDLRRDLFGHLLTLSPSFYGRMPTGDVVSRSLNDLGNVRMVLGPGLLNAINTAVVYVTTLGAMLILSPRLTLVSCLPYPFFVWFAWRFIGRLYGQSKTVQEKLSEITTRVQENLGGVNVVKAYGREEHEAALFSTVNRAYLDAGMRYVRTQAVIWPLMASLGGGAVVLVLWFGGRMTIEGRIGLGDLVAFLGYLAILTWPTFALGWILSIVQRGQSSLARISEILEARSDVADPPGAIEPLHGGPPRIEIRDLRFRYPGEPNEVLRGIDLAIEPGAWVAVVGRTGAGKSTLLKLLPRLYPAPPGAILLDGADVAGMQLAALRSRLVFVPQDPMLFSMTVSENIAFGVADAAEESVREAARVAAIEKDVSSFPHGWETRVGERGILLSMGQRQRIALARALVARASAYVLDDPFASVDAETEAEILSRLRETTRGATVIVVTHRLEAVRWADRIFVLEEGRVAQAGRHDELIAEGGVYLDLYRSRRIEEELQSLA